MIKLYDTLTKFWVDTFLKIKVSIALVYRIGNPITYGCALTMIYIVVNNYVVEKKVRLLEVLPIILLCINIYINGSRSPTKNFPDDGDGCRIGGRTRNQKNKGGPRAHSHFDERQCNRNR